MPGRKLGTGANPLTDLCGGAYFFLAQNDRAVVATTAKTDNSFSVDETGGVFIVTDHALYRFDAGAGGVPVITWRQPYDRGSQQKPGQLAQGSGTTPTLLGGDPKASLANGLVYVYTKPATTLVDAWYLTAIDIRTGQTAFSQLTGTGPGYNNHYASIYLGPDGSAYIPTLAGMVRVHDTG